MSADQFEVRRSSSNTPEESPSTAELSERDRVHEQMMVDHARVAARQAAEKAAEKPHVPEAVSSSRTETFSVVSDEITSSNSEDTRPAAHREQRVVAEAAGDGDADADGVTLMSVSKTHTEIELVAGEGDLDPDGDQGSQSVTLTAAEERERMEALLDDKLGDHPNPETAVIPEFVGKTVVKTGGHSRVEIGEIADGRTIAVKTPLTQDAKARQRMRVEAECLRKTADLDFTAELIHADDERIVFEVPSAQRTIDKDYERTPVLWRMNYTKQFLRKVNTLHQRGILLADLSHTNVGRDGGEINVFDFSSAVLLDDPSTHLDPQQESERWISSFTRTIEITDGQIMYITPSMRKGIPLDVKREREQLAYVMSYLLGLETPTIEGWGFLEEDTRKQLIGEASWQAEDERDCMLQEYDNLVRVIKRMAGKRDKQYNSFAEIEADLNAEPPRAVTAPSLDGQHYDDIDVDLDPAYFRLGPNSGTVAPAMSLGQADENSGDREQAKRSTAEEEAHVDEPETDPVEEEILGTSEFLSYASDGTSDVDVTLNALRKKHFSMDQIDRLEALRTRKRQELAELREVRVNDPRIDSLEADIQAITDFALYRAKQLQKVIKKGKGQTLVRDYNDPVEVLMRWGKFEQPQRVVDFLFSKGLYDEAAQFFAYCDDADTELAILKRFQKEAISQGAALRLAAQKKAPGRISGAQMRARMSEDLDIYDWNRLFSEDERDWKQVSNRYDSPLANTQQAPVFIQKMSDNVGEGIDHLNKDYASKRGKLWEIIKIAPQMAIVLAYLLMAVMKPYVKRQPLSSTYAPCLRQIIEHIQTQKKDMDNHEYFQRYKSCLQILKDLEENDQTTLGLDAMRVNINRCLRKHDGSKFFGQ